ncbi:MAG: FYDLN acid domain-containing protein [Alphaproteobacteria bacterium]|nr:FYDLN acid domain-containing protein [Alphaproteobacteria bacterium]
MYKADWGQKFICPDCSQKFYSMGKIEGLQCPACKKDYDIQANRKLRNNQMLKAPVAAKTALDDEVIVEEVIADDIFEEDVTSDDDVPVVKENKSTDDDDNEDADATLKSAKIE